MDEWYKEFGHRPQLTYYRLQHLDGEEHVDLEEFLFDSVSRRVLHTRHIRMSFKWWVDSLASNTIHRVPEPQVPFLFHF
jgi:hypothetical protein